MITSPPPVKLHARNWLKKHSSRGQRLLDYGFGSMDFTESWSELQLDVRGLDIAQSEPPPSDRIVLYSQEGAVRCPDNDFDLVLALFVIEHVLDLNETFIELARVMSPGALMLLATTFDPHPSRSNARLMPGHLREFYRSDISLGSWFVSIQELQQILSKAGLEIMSWMTATIQSGEEHLHVIPSSGDPSTEGDQLWITIQKQ